MLYSYTIQPKSIDESAKYSVARSPFGFGNFISLSILVSFLCLALSVLFKDPIFFGGILVFGFIVIARDIEHHFQDSEHTKKVIENQIEQAGFEAKAIAEKLNLILSKSDEIVNQILPYYRLRSEQCINRAKIEFRDGVFSPFWSEIEEASRYLAYYKETLNQLCQNSELYTCALNGKKHSFPLPFPFAKITIPEQLLGEYKSIIRKAQQNPTFSIIWEQRRNTQILIAGFNTLEGAIRNMNDNIASAIYDLNHSINSALGEMKYIQKERLTNFIESRDYLDQTLSSIDNKLYYIQWKKRPLGSFSHK